MQIVRNINPTFLKVVKKQKSAGGNFRLLTYSLCQNVDEGLLIYNTLSSEMILLEGEEATNYLSIPYLKENWFVVPTNFDDKKFVKQYRQIRKLLDPKPIGITGYTILTTTDCNARCFYCYELGRGRIPMSVKTAEKVAGYIIHNYNILPPNSKPITISLKWFGGEPLYNSKAIDVICEKLSAQEIKFTSSMISNAYLFDEETVVKASKLWNLKSVQVTLDGTESTYNKSKNYIYTDGSAYQRVIKNVDLLLNYKIKVVIRLNVDLYNADNLMLLADELKDRFGGRKGLTVYSHPLFEMSSHIPHLRTNENRSKVYKRQQELEQSLEEKGFLCPGSVFKDIKFSKCMADNDRSIVIAPTGDIGLCEHFTESEFFSHIDYPDKKDTKVVESFHELFEDEPQCDTCAFYPLCIRLKKCEEDTYCFDEIKEMNLSNTRKAMARVYETWKKKQDVDKEEYDLDNNNC